MTGIEEFKEIVKYANARYPEHKSIVQNSIVAALNGKHGNHHATKRTKGSRLDVNILMSTYFWFDLIKLHDRLLYGEDVKQATTITDMLAAIRKFRNNLMLDRKDQ